MVCAGMANGLPGAGFSITKSAGRGTLSEVANLLKRIADTPLGKRTVVADAVAKASSDFESLKSVYGDAFVELLKKKD